MFIVLFMILGLALAGVMAMFALQNMEIVTVSFFAWQFTGPQALVFCVVAITGALAAFFIFVPRLAKGTVKSVGLDHQNQNLQKELDICRHNLEAAMHRLSVSGLSDNHPTT